MAPTDAEAEWKLFLDNGKPAKQALLSHATAKVAAGVELYYEIYQIQCGVPPAPDSPAAQPQQQRQQEAAACTPSDGPLVRMLMIMGFGAQAHAWLPLIHQLLRLCGRATTSCAPCTLQICIYDNRGIGKSSVPPSKKSYTTDVMAADAFHLLGHLRWPSAHIVGFSMGGMISTKLAATHPQAVTSLSILSVTAGGWQILPAVGSALRAIFKGGLFDKSDEGRAAMDVAVHFSGATRRTRLDSGAAVGELLVSEYVRSSEQGGRQPAEGERGHFNACWTHSVTESDVKRIRQAGMPVLVVHGIHDILAQPKYGRRLAKRLGAKLVLVDGAHFTPRENAPEIAYELLALVFAAAGLPWAAPRPQRAPTGAAAAAAGSGADKCAPLLAGKERRRGDAAPGCFGCCS